MITLSRVCDGHVTPIKCIDSQRLIRFGCLAKLQLYFRKKLPLATSNHVLASERLSGKETLISSPINRDGNRTLISLI